MKKPIVIVCDCGGYHAKCDCPKKWEEFNRWFAAGIAERKAKSEKKCQ